MSCTTVANSLSFASSCRESRRPHFSGRAGAYMLSTVGCLGWTPRTGDPRFLWTSGWWRCKAKTSFSKKAQNHDFKEFFLFWLKLHQKLSLRVYLTTKQCWFKYWLGVILEANHYLNQCWLSSPKNICVTQSQWVNLGTHIFSWNNGDTSANAFQDQFFFKTSYWIENISLW